MGANKAINVCRALSDIHSSSVFLSVEAWGSSPNPQPCIHASYGRGYSLRFTHPPLPPTHDRTRFLLAKTKMWLCIIKFSFQADLLAARANRFLSNCLRGHSSLQRLPACDLDTVCQNIVTKTQQVCPLCVLQLSNLYMSSGSGTNLQIHVDVVGCSVEEHTCWEI